MGVSGLWPLLEPVGRRVNIEALTNKRLAVGRCSPSRSRKERLTQQLTLLFMDRCRRVDMARPVHQSHAKREGRDAAQRPPSRFLSTHLSPAVSPHPTCVRFRRSNSRYQEAHNYSQTSVSNAYTNVRTTGEDSVRDATCSSKPQSLITNL